MRICLLLIGLALPAVDTAQAAHTNNILLTGYWPPTNNMIRKFSTNPEQNPNGWKGENWDDSGYDVHSYFPEFPNGVGQGEGDLEVDSQDPSEDFWRIVEEVRPVAIITFSRGFNDNSWEIEKLQRNLDTWIDDYEAPFQPTVSPPEQDQPAGFVRESSLPMGMIRRAVDDEPDLNVDARIDRTGFGGGFLSEYIAYHGVWYQSLHADPSDDYYTVAAGHIHVGQQVTRANGRRATELTLGVLTDYLDTQLPEPGTAMLLGSTMLLALRRRGVAEN